MLCCGPVQAQWEPFALESYDGRSIDGEAMQLAVRERRDDPDSRWIRVGVVRLPARRANGVPIVFLSGGPGIPATGIARVPVYFDLFDALRETGDVLLVDQRGSGNSVPNLTCPPFAIPRDFASSDAAMHSALLGLVQSCAAHWRALGVDLRGYSTKEIAADVSAVRRAIGAPKIRLLAFSYGSEVAFELLRQAPKTIDRVVFASTRAPDTLLKMPSAWDDVLAKLGLLARVRELVARLDASPIEADGFRVGGAGLLGTLRRDLADGRAIPKIPALLDDPAALVARIHQMHTGLGTSFNLMTLAVDCASGWSDARLEQTRRDAATAAMRNVNAQWDASICDAIAGHGTPPHITRIPTPALFITGTLDANAPVAQTDALRRHFTNSRHLIIEGGAHETLPMPVVQKAVLEFLR